MVNFLVGAGVFMIGAVFGASLARLDYVKEQPKNTPKVIRKPNSSGSL